MVDDEIYLDIDSAIISYVVDNQDIKTVIEGGVSPEIFADGEANEIWQWILEYYGKYGDVPTRKILRSEYPLYDLQDDLEAPIEYYIDEQREVHKSSLLRNMLLTASDLESDGQTGDAVGHLQAQLNKLHAETTVVKDVDIVSQYEERLEEYIDRAKNGNKLRGIPTGFHTLDYNLLGMQPEQLWTMIGVAKSGKSTSSLKIAINAHESGAKVLFVTFEMSSDEQASRYDAMISGVPHRDIQAGTSIEQLEKIERALVARKNLPPFTMVHDRTSTLTLSGLAVKIEEHRPDIVFVDGAYMMEDELGEDQNSPQALTNITRGFKRLCQRFKIPIFITTQALQSRTSKSTGLTTASIGYSSSFAQDSDVILGTESSDADDTVKKMRIVAARNSAGKEFLVQWDWATSTFEEYRNVEDEEPEESTFDLGSILGDDADEDGHEDHMPVRRRRRRPRA